MAELGPADRISAPPIYLKVSTTAADLTPTRQRPPRERLRCYVLRLLLRHEAP